MTDLLLLLESVFLPLVSLAAPIPTLVLPSNTDLSLLASAHVHEAHFSTDPLAPLAPVQATDAALELFIHGGTPNSANQQSFRLLVRNNGTATTGDVTIVAQTEPAVSVFTSNPEPLETTTETTFTEFVWLLPNIPPGQYTTVDLMVQGTQPANVFAEAHYSSGGTTRVAGTSRVAQATTETTPTPTATPAPTRSPQAVIICDPSEQGCTEIFPSLGVNFQRVRSQDSRPVVCSSLDPRGCQEKRPQLGLRFQEAVAVVEPGECRVAEDDRISEAAFHDSFLRQTQPAAFYLRPLFDSGLDFKRLVHQAILDNIKHNILVRDRLWAISQQYWSRHLEIIQQARSGQRTGSDAINELQQLLTQWSTDITNAQADLRRDYQTIRIRREERYNPIADTAALNAAESITRAGCPVNGEDAALRARLEDAKTRAYIPLLDELVLYYSNTTEPTFAGLVSTIRTQWEATLFPALRALDADNPAPLDQYATGSLTDLFDRAFRGSYIAHAERDEDRFEAFRLTEWEIALDQPKTVATQCQNENNVKPNKQPVETTVCESGSFGESINPGLSDSAKGTAGALRPPDTSTLTSTTTIDSAQVDGSVCGGGPGDPFWAADCSCKCGDLLPDPNNPDNVVACEQLFPITRHDIFVTSKEECVADGPKHADPFF